MLLLIGASGVFGELQDSLNAIWKVEPQKSSGIVVFLKDRFVSFSMVLGSFLMMVSMILSTRSRH